MLTPDEVKLLSHAYSLRHDEEDVDLWFAPDDSLFSEAARLWASGRLDRKWHEGDFVFRLSDKTWTQAELARTLHRAAASTN